MPVSLETALICAVESLGSYKAVAVRLRPEWAYKPDDAGRWLAHCLDEDHAQRLTYAQQVCIFRWACDAGHHDGFRALAEGIGYRIEPVDERAEITRLAKRAADMAAKSTELSQEVEARMRAAHINTEA